MTLANSTGTRYILKKVNTCLTSLTEAILTSWINIKAKELYIKRGHAGKELQLSQNQTPPIEETNCRVPEANAM